MYDPVEHDGTWNANKELSILSASNQSLIAVLTDKSGTNEDDLAFPLDRLLRCPRRRRVRPGSRRQGLCCQSGCGRRGRLVHVVGCLIRCYSLDDVAQVRSDLVQIAELAPFTLGWSRSIIESDLTSFG